MHVKRLYSPSVRDSLAAAREQLGPGALVLSTELVPAPGWHDWIDQRVVRLTAAAERPETEPESSAASIPVSEGWPATPERRQGRPSESRSGVVARLKAIRLDEDLWRATPVSLAAALLREAALEERTCH
jgi:hypothetical protein